MQFTLGDDTTDVALNTGKTATVGETKYYLFTYEVAAKEMADIITAQMVYTNGDDTRYGKEYTYSVKEYAKALITREGATEKEIALAKAMLNYGAYAQTYFGYNTTNLANVGYADETIPELAYKEDMELLKDWVPSEPKSSENLTYMGSTLILESAVKVRHYFKLAVGKTAPTGLNEYKAQDGVTETDIYYYESEGIPVAEWGKMTEYKDGDTVLINYCPLSYVTTVVATKDTTLQKETKLQNLMKALYLYYEAVLEYNESIATN